jgi:starch-binding outer membrane protein, SusD/RagB family
MRKLAIIATVVLGACDLDVPDLNNPGLDDLENNPTPAKVSAAATGLFIGNRAGIAAENGYVMQLGILGREAYNFDSADPRYVGELLQGALNSGSPFGGNFWPNSYSNVRNANILLHALDKVEGMSDGDIAGIRGFAHTMQAIDLLVVTVTHDTNGEVVDADLPIDQVGPLVDRDAALAAIAKLLDDSLTDLGNAGGAFAFNFSPGFAGFDTPMTFVQFNRAIRARVALYQKDYATTLTALQASFLDDTATGDLNLGVFQVYGTASGDTTNSLINPNIYAHPALATDAQKKANNDPDDRLTTKVGMAAKPGSAQNHSSNLAFLLYTTPTSPVPIIRNEELILIRAEAEFNMGDAANLTKAADDLNTIRTRSGGLAVKTINATNFVDELLYNRRYSLMFEGGHRWIDTRRLNRITDLPLDDPSDVRNVRYPIPLNECNARPDEQRCTLGSQ